MPSSDPAHGHDPRHELARQESLSLLALGEQIDADLGGHIHDCPDCQAELAALRRTVALGRHIGEHAGEPHTGDLLPTPSPAVWRHITAELGLPASPARAPRRERSASGRPRPWRHWSWRHWSWRHWVAAAAAAVLIGGAGAVGGYLAGHNTGPSGAAVTATAQLRQMPGGPNGVHGQATVRATPTGLQVSVRTASLPLRDGYYEVWLFNPVANKMVAIGTLPQDGAASFPVPPGLDVHAYHVVDVSAQDYDGNPAHKQSVLRGALTQ